MAEKQTPYELLGLTDKARPEEIRQAYEARRLALEAEPDGEERRNRLAFLQHARDLLLDSRKRALHDHQSRRAAVATAPSRSLMVPMGIAFVLVAAAYPVWRLLTPKPIVATPAIATPVARTAPAERAPSPLPRLEDVEALMDGKGAMTVSATVPPAAAPAATPASSPPPKSLADAPHGGLIGKILDSTYLIVGGYGFGTGVVIDTDRLLTNCHVVAPNVLKGPIYAISPVTQQRTRIVAAAFLVKEDACVVHAPGLNGKPIAMGDAARLPPRAAIHNVGFADGRLIASQGYLIGLLQRHGQTYLASSNYCDHGVSGGPLVDDEGRLVGLTSGGVRDRSVCLSLTAETARQVLSQTLIAIDAFPTNYMTNLARRW